MFLEASKALNPRLATVKPQAMITMSVLSAGSRFDIPTFLTGEVPEAKDVAVEERLIVA